MSRKSPQLTRRQVLKNGVSSAAVVAASATVLGNRPLSAASYSRILGSNAGLRGATIGLNGRGRDHINGLKSHLVALCDCDEAVLGRTVDKFKADNNREVESFSDFRKLLDRDDIDFVSVATPNHTHSLIAIHAIQAGKDVYCEKPVSHNVWEGRQLVNAAAKYDRVVQSGTQSRSSPGLQEALAYVQSGKLGKALYAVGTCYKPRKSIGKLDKPLQIPSNIDYDLWCGPAAKVDLYRPKLHYDWHWDFNTGNGDMGNQGIHQMDIARWFLGHETISPRVISIGGRLGYDDAGDTPNTQTVIHDYASAPIIFETRGLPKAKEFQDSRWGRSMDNYLGSQIGVIVFYENGRLVIPSYTKATAFDNDGNQLEAWDRGGNHYANFLEAVESQDSSGLNAPIIEGHLSSALCHTGGVSHQVGQTATVAEIMDSVTNDQFADSIDRMVQHLEANKIDLSKNPLTLGQDLKFDLDTEEVINNSAAAALLKRVGREGFEVPEIQAAMAAKG